MAKLPTVAIIGKPNTGKSTLFNRMIGHRKSIVSDVPGTTRDHVAARVQSDEFEYLLIDTGGMGGGTVDTEFEDDVHRQSQIALENADVILLTMNSREDLTKNDFAVVEALRKYKQRHVPVILIITKCDNLEAIDEVLPQFYELNVTDHIIPISAVHNTGMDELERTIEEQLTVLNFTAEEDEAGSQLTKIAIIGKPNVGKSSLVNAFMSETQRAKSPLLVSDIAGTTRDTTDTIIRHNDVDYLFMDTAGIKRRKQTEENIEVHAYFRSLHAIEQCDIAILVLDATTEIAKQDKRIANLAVEEGKGLIIMLNKIDQLDSEQKAAAIEHVEQTLAFCRYAVIIPCSAETREGLLKLFEQIAIVQRNRERRLATKDLHRWLEDTVYGKPLGQLVKTKHITQADEMPPTFVLFVKDPKKIQVSQLRYLDNQLRQTFDFTGTPVRWITKSG